jgi:DNA-binding NarL/FixJ family response regulator
MGLEASQEILRNSPSCKIIGVSMHAEPAFAIKMLQIGAKGYVTKNSSQEEMIDAILEVQKGNKYICEEIKNNMLGKMLDENADGSKINTLTLREIQIINLIKEGFSSSEIAADLQLAVGTVESHRYNILKKLDLKNAASLVNFINNNSNFISN